MYRPLKITDRLGLQLGVEGNICADPLFCDLASGSVDVHAGSPCEASPAATWDDACAWIGAGRVGCGPAAGDEAATAVPAPDCGETFLRAPNPLRPADRLEWGLAGEAAVGAGRIAIHVLDVTGRRVRVLDAGVARTGVCGVPWDGADAYGRSLPSGIYFFRMQLGGRCLLTRALVVP